MANTRSVSRTTTKAKEETVNPVEAAVEKKETKTTQKKVSKIVQKTFNPDDEILCRSITGGELILIGKKTENKYRWANVDDECYVLYQDLQSLKVVRSDYLYAPLFIICDDELIKEWSDIEELYSTLLSDNEIMEMLTLSPQVLKKNLLKLPAGLLNHIKDIVGNMIANEQFDSVQRIKVIDEVLDTDFLSYVK